MDEPNPTKLSGCHQYIWETSPNIWVFKKLKYKKLRLVNLGQNVLPALFAGEPERKMDSNKVNKLIVEGGGGSSCEEVL